MPVPVPELGWLGPVLRELALWSGVLLLVASALSLYVARKRRATAAVVAETPRSDAADVRSPGVVRVRGRVEPAPEAGTVTSPIGAEDCVLHAWEIEEQYDTSSAGTWETAAWGVHAVPFRVADATGSLRVAVADRTVGNETDDVFTPETLLVDEGVSVSDLRCEFDAFDVHVETDHDEAPPDRVAAFLDATDGVSADPMATDLAVDSSRRKYREATLRPGDEVSVLGHARDDAPAAGSSDLVVTQSDEATLYLSTRSLEDVPDGVGGVLFGVLTGLVGAVLVAAAFLL